MRVCLAQNVSLSDHMALSTHLRSISKYLADEADIELILLPLKGKKIPSDIPDSIEIHEINGSLYSLSGNLKYSYNLYKKLNEINKQKHIDVIHCLNPNSSVFGAALFKRRSPETRIIYDFRSPWIEMSIARGSIPAYAASVYRRIAYFSETILNEYVDGYIFITEGLKKFYEKKIRLDSKPIEIIPSGVDTGIFSKKDPDIIRNKYNLKNSDLLLGYIGGIAKMRELDFILRSFKKLTEVDKNYKLMLVGDGDDKENLEASTRKLNIQDNVIFTGEVPYEQVPYYISALDMGICHLPDRFIYRYSFPLKILEYLACGVPVIASDMEAHSELKTKIKGINIYNRKDDLEELIKNIANYKADPEEIEKFEWTELTRDLSIFYSKMVSHEN